MMETKPSVVIIGAGFTGCALAWDLSQRGFTVTVLDRGDLANGTSGRTHGLLHSGARYCVTDTEAAVECIQENIILRQIARQCIEFNSGWFVALDDKDLEYASRFAQGAQNCGIPLEIIPVSRALEMEPSLNPGLKAVFQVPDGVFDPLRLAMAFAASARKLGANFATFHEVVGFLKNGKGNVTGVAAINRHSKKMVEFKADITVNAAGAWAGRIAGLADVRVPVVPTPGIMVAFDQRVTRRVINRLCEPDDGDILLPQRRMAVIGTTSYEINDPDYIPVVPAQVEEMRRRAQLLVPGLKNARLRGIYTSARPLISGMVNGRSLSRTFKCFDHLETDGIDGFITITGGKATTCRKMAEKAADVACAKLGWNSQCETSLTTLADYHDYYLPIGDEP
jgi:glycerol-3-phosphate dehydrogenase